MTEQKNTKPHPNPSSMQKRIERIFHILGCGFLGLLCIAALILQAPWKLSTLLIIIFLVEAIAPKAIKKWFWRSTVALIGIYVVWVFLPDDNEGWRPYTFDQELVSMEAERAIPAEENAAVIYNQLLKNYDPDLFQKDFIVGDPNFCISLTKFWTSTEYPDAAAWLAENQNTIEQLILAGKFEQCRFPIAADLNDPNFQLPQNLKEVTDFWQSLQYKRLSPMRHWRELLIYSANNDVAESRNDQALEKYITVLQMAKYLHQQPTLMDFLVSMAFERRILKQINSLVITKNPTNEQLLLLDNALQGIDYEWNIDFKRILDREKLLFKDTICAILYQTNEKGQIRYNRDPDSNILINIMSYFILSGFIDSSFQTEENNNYWPRKISKAKVILSWILAPSTPQKTVVIIDNVYESFYAMTEPDFNWQSTPERFSLTSIRPNFRFLMELIAKVYNPDSYLVHDLFNETTMSIQSSRILIAIKYYKNQTGHWPELLEILKDSVPAKIFIDPMNNNSFVYKLAGEKFVLYSKGPNNIDENGIRGETAHSIRLHPSPNPSPREIPDPDDFPIWPPQEE